MAQKILGIDLGTFSVKMALLERTYDDFRILQFVEQPLNLQTRLPHHELLKLALEQVMQSNDFQADVVSASFPGHLLSTRLIEVPFTQPKKIDPVVEFELEGFIPFDIGDLHFDYHILSKTEEKSTLLCAYMPQERFSLYLDNLAGAGVDPKYFGADLTDLCGVVPVTMVPQDEVYALCDIGHSKTNICLMHGKELCYVRTIGLGGLHFTRAVQRAFNVNFEKAESLKLSRGRVNVREQESDQISRILGHVATELVAAIKQTGLAFDNLGGHPPLSAFYCTGGGSKLPGLLDFLSFHLRANVLELDSLSGLEHGLEDATEASRIMTQALANALRPVFPTRVPKINFRKGAFAFKQDIQVLTHELRNVGAMLGVIALLGVGYYFYADYHYENKMAAIDAKVEKIVKTELTDLNAGGARARGKGGGGGGSVGKYLKQMERKYNEFKTQSASIFGGGSVSVLEVMQEISRTLPPKKELMFEMTEFNFADDFVRINARTDDPLNKGKIVESLAKSEMFPKIEATDPQSKPGNVWDFTMKIDFKKGGA